MHSCSASLARLPSEGNGSGPGVAVGLATLVATAVHGPAHPPDRGLVSTLQTLLAPAVFWNRTPLSAGSGVPSTEKGEFERDDDVVAGVGGDRHGDRRGGVVPAVGQRADASSARRR